MLLLVGYRPIIYVEAPFTARTYKEKKLNPYLKKLIKIPQQFRCRIFLMRNEAYAVVSLWWVYVCVNCSRTREMAFYFITIIL